MTGDDIGRPGKGLHGPPDGRRPCGRIGIGKIAQIGGFRTFYETASIEDLIPIKPDDDIVPGMTSPGIEGAESVITKGEGRISCEDVLSLVLLSLSAQLAGLDRGPGGDALFLQERKPRRTVLMKMRGQATDHFGMVPGIDTIQKWLELRGVPGWIEKDRALAGDQVHAVGWIRLPTNLSVSRIDIEVAGQVGNGQFRGKESNQRQSKQE